MASRNNERSSRGRRSSTNRGRRAQRPFFAKTVTSEASAARSDAVPDVVALGGRRRQVAPISAHTSSPAPPITREILRADRIVASAITAERQREREAAARAKRASKKRVNREARRARMRCVIGTIAGSRMHFLAHTFCCLLRHGVCVCVCVCMCVVSLIELNAVSVRFRSSCSCSLE